MNSLAVSLAVLLLGVFGALAAPRTRECEMSAVARDFYTKAPEHFYHCKDTATGELLDLAFPEDGHKDIFTGDTATVEGDDDGTVMTVQSYTHKTRPSEFTPAGRERRALTTRSAMVVILRFNNNGNFVGSGVDTDSERAALAATVNNTLFGVYDSAVKRTHAGAWNDCSYGKMTLGYDIDGKPNDFAKDYPGSNADIFYVDVPYVCTAGSGYCTQSYNTGSSCGTNEYYGWAEYALNYLTANRAGFNRNAWQHKVFIYPFGAGISCNFVGMGNTACSSSYCHVWIPSTYANQVQDYTHEMGHNLGLAHAGTNDATSGNTEYGDYSCAMGYCCTTRCYNAPHAAELGWLTPVLSLSSATIADQQSITQSLPSMSVSNRGAISIKMDWGGSSTTYWVQFKTAHNYDRFGSTAWLNNVQIKKWNGADYERTDHIWTGNAGSVWSHSSGLLHVRINAIDLNSKTATITVKRGSGVPSSTIGATTRATVSTTASTTTKASSTTTRAPTTTTKAGTGSTTRAPTSTTRAPTSTTRAPTSTTRAPTSTTRAPTSTTSPYTTKTCKAKGVRCSRNRQCCSNKCHNQDRVCR